MEAVKSSLAGLKKQFGDLQQRFANLGPDVEALPADLPGYPQLRSSFYATEEARGVSDAKVSLLSDRLDAALAAGRSGEVQQIAKEIDEAEGQARQVDEAYLKLLHQVLAFQRAARAAREPLVAK